MKIAGDESVPSKSGPNEADLEELLREVGTRDEPPRTVMDEVRAAVHSEWQLTVNERRWRWRLRSWRVAAGFVVAVSIAVWGARFLSTEPTLVATIVHSDGLLLTAAGAKDEWRARAVGQRIAAGETVQADDRSRALVSFDAGVSVRLDHNTILEVVSDDRVILALGALYVDSPPEVPGGTAFTVQAHASSVRHIGTQYEVRTHADAVEVSVREGHVMIDHENGTSTAEAGEKIHLTAAGEITRSALSRWHSDWDWVTAAAPAFDIDKRTLSEFLTWVAGETGHQIVFATSEAEAAASHVKLRGSIAGLDLDTALTAVLATTQLRRFPTKEGLIGIALAEGHGRPSAQRTTR